MSAEHDEHGLAHVASIKTLVGTFAALISLTILTVAVRFIDFGDANLYVALIIAGTKASLVCLYFMHLRYDRPFHALAVIFGLLAIILFISVLMIDTGQYHRTIEGFNPNYVTPDLDHPAAGAAGHH